MKHNAYLLETLVLVSLSLSADFLSSSSSSFLPLSTPSVSSLSSSAELAACILTATAVGAAFVAMVTDTEGVVCEGVTDVEVSVRAEEVLSFEEEMARSGLVVMVGGVWVVMVRE